MKVVEKERRRTARAVSSFWIMPKSQFLLRIRVQNEVSDRLSPRGESERRVNCSGEAESATRISTHSARVREKKRKKKHLKGFSSALVSC